MERLFALVVGFYGIAGWRPELMAGMALAAACLIVSVVAVLLTPAVRPGGEDEGRRDGGGDGEGRRRSDEAA
ncbi:hypothetical protein OHR68_41680 [Spirillospora sp. NBC_00431]